MVPAAGHDHTMYVLNQCLQHIGKHEGMKRTRPMGKKTREAILWLLQQHSCSGRKRTHNNKVGTAAIGRNKRNKNRGKKGV
tara:strand:- start:124 stop:366 length:243 start_codon:yes stop_codon:yes gene_type:complete